MIYIVFKRTWWKLERGRLVPGPGRKYKLAEFQSEGEAYRYCQKWNKENEPGELSRKAEYTRKENYY